MRSGPVGTEKNGTFNIFKILGIADKEILICRLLGELLRSQRDSRIKVETTLAFLKQLHIADLFSLSQLQKRTSFWKKPSIMTAGLTLSFIWEIWSFPLK